MERIIYSVSIQANLSGVVRALLHFSGCLFLQCLHVLLRGRVGDTEALGYLFNGNGWGLVAEPPDLLLSLGRDGATADLLALCFGSLHACFDAFGDKGAFKLGKRGEDAEDERSLWGRGVDVLLVGDEVDAEAPELIEGVDEGLGRAGESVVPPDEDDVHLSFPNVVEEALVVGSLFGRACGVVNVFVGNVKASTLGILSKLEELGFWVLAFVEGRDSGVDGDAFFGASRHVQKVLLLDTPWAQIEATGLRFRRGRGHIEKVL